VADYLSITVATVRRRQGAGTFPDPDAVENGIEWWEITTLDGYKRKLARQKNRRRKKA
jgi:CRISPR/Cas system CSM-associated protein Csm4 (group 5 of RAMP superfamily)